VKKKSTKMILSILILILSLQTSFGYIIFADVEDHWSEEYIIWDSNNLRLIEGFEDGTFKPEEKISRIDFVAALNNLLHSKGLYKETDADEFSEDFTYTDIEQYSQDHFHIWELSNYIKIKANTAISFKGIFDSEEFNPLKPITRYEAALLARAITTAPVKLEEATYTDIHKGLPFYKEIIELVSNGIMTGFNNSLRLEEEITRAESAVILKRIYNDLDFLSIGELQYATVKINNTYYSQPIFEKASGEKAIAQEKSFINAVTTLDYISFVGYIPYNERHLYDSKPLETLWRLKQEGYENLIGLNYYLIKYDDSLMADEVLGLIQEGMSYIEGLSSRDIEGVNEFLSLASYYNSSEEIFKAAEKLFMQSQDIEAMLPIGLYIAEHYKENNNIEALLALYEELYEKTDDIELKGQLINNYIYYAAETKGRTSVLEKLNTMRNKAIEDPATEEKLIFILTALIKQLSPR